MSSRMRSSSPLPHGPVQKRRRVGVTSPMIGLRKGEFVQERLSSEWEAWVCREDIPEAGQMSVEVRPTVP